MLALSAATAAALCPSTLAARPALTMPTATSPAYEYQLRSRRVVASVPSSRTTSPAMQLRRGTQDAVTALALILWYAASIVNNQSSKVLVARVGAEALTLTQCLVAFGCGSLLLRELPAFASRAQLRDTALLAAAFLAGCYSLNACLASMCAEAIASADKCPRY